MIRLFWILILGLAAGCGQEGGKSERPDNAEQFLVEELAKQLNPNTPGLAEFYEEWDAGNVEKAKESLLVYFRNKKIPEAAVPKPLPVELQVMRNALDAWRGSFNFQGVKGRAAEPDGPIDWTYQGPRDDSEWTWFLHRHFFLREMLVLYQEQGHEEFVIRMQDYLLDWFWKYPAPDHRSFSASWRALEAARRITDSWLPIYSALRAKDVLRDETLLAIVAGAGRHGEYLRAHHHFGGNHLVTEMMALATIASVWPEFRDSQEWMSYAADRSLEEMNRQIYPDGAHKELANHYQWIAGSSFQQLYEVLGGSGASETAEKLRPGMERIWDYYAKVVRPSGTGPLNNDSDLEPNKEQLLTLADFYQRPDWLYIATSGEKGVIPEGRASQVFPWAGHAVLRSDWGREADWVFFDAGPYGSDHQQMDRLHISASLQGRDLLVDSGRYVYRDDEWSRFFRSPEAHNVPTFSAHSRITPDTEATTPQEQWTDFAGVLPTASGWIPLSREGEAAWTGTHSRTVALGDGFVWIVDQVDLNRPDEAIFRWRFHPDLDLEPSSEGWSVMENSKEVARWISASTSEKEGAKIEGQTEGKIQGWYSPEYNDRLPNQVLVFRSKPASRATFTWLLLASDTGIKQANLTANKTGSTLVISRENGAETYQLDFPSSGKSKGSAPKIHRITEP